MAKAKTKSLAGMSIFSKLLLVFISIILIPMIFINYVELMYVHHFVFDSKLEKLNAIADLKAEQVKMSIDRVIEDVEMMREFQDIKQAIPMLTAYNNDRSNPKYIAVKQALDAYVRLYRRVYHYRDLMLLDTNGTVIYSIVSAHEHGWVKKMADDISANSSNGGYYYSIFQYDETTKDSGVAVGSAVYDTHGKQIGSIVVEVAISSIYKSIVDLKNLGKTGEAIIVREVGDDGIVLNPLRFDENGAFNVKFDLIKLGHVHGRSPDERIENGVIYTDYRDVQTVLVWRHLNIPNMKPHLAVIVKMDGDEIFEKVHAFEEMFWFLIAITILAGALVAFSIARSIAKPVYELQRGMKKVGRGDLDYKVATDEQDEIGELSRSFDEMVSNLKKITDDLNGEIKIRERTEEDLITAKLAVEASSQAKSEFLSMMSHELRTPLNAIIGFSEILIDENFGQLNDKQKEYVKDVLDSGNHLLSLINDVLDIKKIEAGRMELKLRKVSVKSMVASGILMVKEKAVNHNIEIEENIDKNVGSIDADEIRMKQIMYNLLSNAVKFTPDGGKVGVDAKKIDDNKILITVWDTGIGIKEKDRIKVFTPFKQIDREKSRKYEGTGLGLMLVKRMVELHSGEIWFESEGENKGSRFSFTIPIKLKKGVCAISDDLLECKKYYCD